jgi:hypothetical protein
MRSAAHDDGRCDLAAAGRAGDRVERREFGQASDERAHVPSVRRDGVFKRPGARMERLWSIAVASRR